MAGMIPRADRLAAQGAIGVDDVAAMERQARESIGQQIGAMDISEIALKAQVASGRKATIVDMALVIQRQIEKAVCPDL
jgi:hypothetical protein